MKKTLPLIISSLVLLLLSCQLKDNQASKSQPSNQNSDTTLLMPYNKMLKPAGSMVFFGDSALENHALDVALSPNGKTLAIEGRYSIVFLNTANNKILYRLVNRKFDKSNAMNTYSGITWLTEDGKQMVMWGTRNNLMRARWDGNKAEIVKVYNFKTKGKARASIPNEVVIRKENSKNVSYVVLNGNNEVVKLDVASGEIIWQKPVALAPYGITFAKNKLYVSNWSGSIPKAGAKPTAGIPWGEAMVDKFGSVSSGTVSIIDPKTGNIIKELKVGLHPNDIISSPDENYVFVANGNDDNITIINTKTQDISETVSVRLNEETNPYFGDTPNGLSISSNGSTLYVANGMDNALAVIALGEKSSVKSKSEKSTILGFIPTAAYPGGIALLKNKRLYVANIEGIGARLTTHNTQNKAYQTFIADDGKKHTTAGAYNTHRMIAAVSIIPVPDSNKLKKYTQIVKTTNYQSRLALLKLLPRKGVKAVPLPVRIGEPSVFKHVVYIIRENRTYDQILGDVSKGNGDPALCTFGKKITPNTHNLVDNYVLLDNYKASGKCSAEGHLWTDASIVTDYIEKNVRAWFRSYTHVLYDAMAYPSTGFLWDNALDHGKSVRIYGETAIPKWSNGDGWSEVYNNFIDKKAFKFTNTTTIERVRGILSPTYPGYDSHNVPDVLRAKAFIDELNEFEKMDGDKFPSLCIMALPNDHTAGTSSNHPTPQAMVADNDYALGQIIEALSKSKFWKNTVVFITEDDSQNGWDHVSAYRTVGMVISPYTKRKEVISTDFNQTSMIRTIEQIMGLPPMNIADATATPMFRVFTDEADFTQYTAVENKIPLDDMNPTLSTLVGKEKSNAIASEQLANLGIDAGDDDLFNRIIWSSINKNKAYPTQYAGNEKDDDDD